MKNRVQDLNNYLFECIERLTDDTLALEQLETEIDRANAVSRVAETIIKTGELALKAYACATEAGVDAEYPRLLAGE